MAERGTVPPVHDQVLRFKYGDGGHMPTEYHHAHTHAGRVLYCLFNPSLTTVPFHISETWGLNPLLQPGLFQTPPGFSGKESG